MTLRVVELFAGIGAQRMALTLAGIPHEVVAICEINRHSLASYRAIYGDCPNLGDITKVERLPPCDLVTYSFPCQDLSLAGKRKGMGEGTRSGLVWEVVRLLEGERERPEWLLMENVPQVLTSPLWPDLLGRLEAMGYRSKWRKLDSSRFGSAQKRVRAFMVSRLSQEPPDLPECAPNAPSLCLRDVMEPTRDERFIKRIPLERIKWRQGYEPSAGQSAPVSEDTGQSFYSRRMLYSSSSSSPTLRTFHSLKDMVKVVGPGSSTPIAEEEGKVYYPDRVLYSSSSSSSSPTVCADHHNNRIKVIADWQREGRLDLANRVYSQDGASPAMVCHGGGEREIKVFACSDDEGGLDQNIVPSKTFRNRRYFEPDGASPCVTASSQGLIKDTKDGGLDMTMRHRTVSARKRRLYMGGGAAPTVLQSDGKIDVFEEQTTDGYLAISVLTPRECWRLMGFPEWAYLRASRVSSETQLYNQAGNSIVVEVLVAIFCAMLRPQRRMVQMTFGMGA